MTRKKTTTSNSGYCNSGDYNSGHRNSGSYNSGHRNSGHGNSGHCNSGSRNSGYGNSGYCNSGHGNSGYCNSGNYNSGGYNSGLFNTNEPKMRLFNRECEYTYSEFLAKFGSCALNLALTEWVLSADMTDAEKEAHPSHETTGGYLKTFTYKEAWSNAWKNAGDDQKRWFLELPNFDADIFFEITGIYVNESTTNID